jgi:acyl-CoA thioester hydrolase
MPNDSDRFANPENAVAHRQAAPRTAIDFAQAQPAAVQAGGEPELTRLEQDLILPAPFKMEFTVRWSDCDPNQHLRHTAYEEYATHVRFSFLALHGFVWKYFEEGGFGPVIFKSEAQYLREVRHGETMIIDMQVEQVSEDGARWQLFHTVKKQNGKPAAVLRVDGAWMDIRERRLRIPPLALRTAMAGLPVSKVPTFRFLTRA